MNNIVCKNCSAENPFYELICRNCKAYLRERIVNIDLWKTAGELIESPSKAFKTIIAAEHKNFVFLITFLVSIKLLINAMLLSQVTTNTYNPFEHFFRNILIVAAAVLVLLSIIAIVEKSVLNLRNNETRFKDNFTITAYSLIPHVFALLFLFPIELVIFGGFLFSNNPSPFMLKETIAYALLGFEVLIILWQLFLITISFSVQSGSIFIAVSFSLIFNALLYYILYLFSHLII